MTASIDSMMATHNLGEPPSSSNSGQADDDMYLTHKVSLIEAWSQRRVQTVTLQDVSTFWPVSPLPLHARAATVCAASRRPVVPQTFCCLGRPESVGRIALRLTTPVAPSIHIQPKHTSDRSRRPTRSRASRYATACRPRRSAAATASRATARCLRAPACSSRGARRRPQRGSLARRRRGARCHRRGWRSSSWRSQTASRRQPGC